jgi:FixJ family two-component response regulator
MNMVEQYPDRVVIIDDDAAVLESFQFMLELAGFPVCAYESTSAYLHDGATRPCCSR